MIKLNDAYVISLGPIDIAIPDLLAAPAGNSVIVTVAGEVREDGSAVYEGRGLKVAIHWDSVAAVPVAEVIEWPGHEDEIGGRPIGVSDLTALPGVA